MSQLEDKLSISQDLAELLEKKGYSKIGDVLKLDFNALIDALTDEKAIELCKELENNGYHVNGFPGLDNPETCKRLKYYFRNQTIDFLDIPDKVTKKIILAYGKNVKLEYFVRPFRMWFALIQDYDVCVLIAKKLKNLQFKIRGEEDILLGKTEFMKKNTILYSPLEELDISKNLYHILVKKEISSIEQLVSYSAKQLSDEKIAGESALLSIRKALSSGRLLLKDDYIIKCTQCGEKYIDDNPYKTVCDSCIKKKKRISKMSKIDISLTGPDYGSYTNLSSGFTLYANFKNTTTELLTVELNDFYVVEEGKQISPKYYLTGYSFDEETIMPNTVKSVGKIWDIERFKYSTFLNDDTYAIITIKIKAEENKRMYKFVYNGESWSIDDYFTV